MKRPHPVLVPLLALLTAGCQPVIELADPALVAVDAPVGVPASDPGPDTPPDPVGPDRPSPSVPPEPTPEPGVEPDWEKRFAELHGMAKSKFEIPPSDREIPVVMSDGRSRPGFLLGVAGDKATFRIPLPGKPDPATVTLARADLGEATRIAVWADDAARAAAMQRIRKEKAAWDEANPPAIAAANRPGQETRTRENRPGGSGPSTGPRTIQPKLNRLKVNSDGSMPVVLNWMKKKVADPRSLRIEQWGKLVRDPRGEGWNIDVIYSSDAGTLGRLREHKRFFLSEKGEIYQAGNVRQ